MRSTLMMAQSFRYYCILACTFFSFTIATNNPTSAPTLNPTESVSQTTNETDPKVIIFIVCGVVIAVLLIVIGALLWVIWKYGKSNKKFVSFDLTNPEFAHIASQEHTSVTAHSFITNTTSLPSPINQLSNNNQSLQLSPQVYNGQNQYQDSITFNSVQNHAIQQIIQQQQQQQLDDEQIINASLQTDLPSSGDESSSSFTVSDANNDNVDALTKTVGTTGGTTTTTTTNTKMTALASNSSHEVPATKSETTKGPKLPKPKTKGHWM